MSATLPAAESWTTTYTLPQTLGLMTGAMVIALVLIALGYRLIKTMVAVREFEAACDKVRQIEDKIEEITKAHAQQCFDYEEIIFERNNEIIDLKNKLLQVNMTKPL